MPKDIRVVVEFKNNLILSKMEEFGIATVAELCRRIGKPTQMTRVGELINMKIPARNKDDSWSKMALDLATFFRCLPEDLFSDFQQEQALEKNRAHAETSFAEIQQSIAARRTPELAARQNELHAAVGRALGTLTAREERMLRLRFGFEGPALSLEEAAQHFSVTWLRAQQIEAKALRKLKHPSRSRLVRQFVDEGTLEDIDV